MKILQVINEEKKIKLIIEHDEKVGFYLIAYLLGSDKSIADYLCDSLEDAFLEADERYGINREDWENYKDVT